MNPVPPEVTREREREAWRMRVQDLMTHDEIAAKLNVDRSTVGKMLKRMRTKFEGTTQEEVEQFRMEQLETLQMMAAEALNAWRRSLQSEKSVTKKKGSGGEDDEGSGGGRGGEVTITNVRDSDGDPRFLAEARAAMADIRKIMGVDAPMKTESTVTGSGPGGAILTQELSKLTVEQLRALAWGDEETLDGLAAEAGLDDTESEEESVPEAESDAGEVA